MIFLKKRIRLRLFGIRESPVNIINTRLLKIIFRARDWHYTFKLKHNTVLNYIVLNKVTSNNRVTKIVKTYTFKHKRAFN
jgi:hypothetical protein